MPQHIGTILRSDLDKLQQVDHMTKSYGNAIFIFVRLSTAPIHSLQLLKPSFLPAFYIRSVFNNGHAS